MKTLYKCDKCGRLFDNKKECQDHEVSDITVAWLLVIHVDPGKGTVSKRPMVWAYHSLSPELSMHKALEPWGDGMSFRVLIYKKEDAEKAINALRNFAQDRLDQVKFQVYRIDPSKGINENDVHNE